MSRPLLITDCDEVLLHMVRHFRDWLDETQGIDFAFQQENWGDAMVRRETGAIVPPGETWPFLDAFFDTEMKRQTLAPGAIDALERIGDLADIVILTNLGDHRRAPRIEQLAAHGIRHRVECNQGGKGEALRRLLDEFAPSVSVFVDDLAYQHSSVARSAPEVWRLQMVAEPEVAAYRPLASDAHARIDDWAGAAGWIAARFAEGPPPALTKTAASA